MLIRKVLSRPYAFLSLLLAFLSANSFAAGSFSVGALTSILDFSGVDAFLLGLAILVITISYGGAIVSMIKRGLGIAR